MQLKMSGNTEEETHLTLQELSERINYKPQTILRKLIGTHLIEGIHFFHPFGGRKMVFIWEPINRDMRRPQISHHIAAIPMANGGKHHG
jgi:hypothetical protein